MKKIIMIVIVINVTVFCLSAQEAPGDSLSPIALVPQTGHTERIRCVGFSPSGKYLFSGAYDGTLRIWDIESGNEIRTFTEYRQDVIAASFSPDEKRIFTVANNTICYLWDVETGNLLWRTSASYYFYQIGWSPDGKTIAISSNSERGKGNIYLIDAENGKRIKKITTEHTTDRLAAIIFSPDGSKIASCSQGKNIIISDVETGNTVQILRGHESNINTLAYSPDGKTLASGSGHYGLGNSADLTIRLWNTATGNVIKVLYGHRGPIYSIVYTQDGKKLISGSRDGSVIIWDAQTGNALNQIFLDSDGSNSLLNGNVDSVNSVSISPDGQVIAAAGSSRTIFLLDINTGQIIKYFTNNTEIVSVIAASNNGKLIASGTGKNMESLYFFNNNSIRMWDIEAGNLLWTYKTNNSPIASMCFSYDDAYLAVSSGAVIVLFDTMTGEVIFYLTGHTSARSFFGFGNGDLIPSTDFSRNGKYLVSGGRDKTVRIWDLQERKELFCFGNLPGEITSVSFSPDNDNVIAGTNTDAVLIFHIPGGIIVNTIDIKGSTSVQYSPDGNTYMVEGWHGSTRIYNRSDNSLLSSFSASGNDARFSPDGKFIVYANDDCEFTIIGIDTALNKRNNFQYKCYQQYKGHNTSVNSVSVIPGTKRLVSGSGDGTLRIWDIESGMEILKFIAFNDDEWVAITPDNYYSSSSSGADKYMKIRIGNELHQIEQYKSVYFSPDIIRSRLIVEEEE
jgi:WD40 repeat protein